jgi:NAD(P)-dependent dehydrogenase (short-subunit alcohol dehydrogenase family)
MNKLKNQVAIVTGGGKGIGKAIAKRFAQEGAKVAIWEADATAGKETVDEILLEGLAAHSMSCDITDERSILSALTEVLDAYGSPEILVNNAGIANVGTASTTSVEDFEKVMEVNAKGMFLCLRNIIPKMVEKKSGTILNLASIASRLGIADRFAYSASKGGCK